MLFKHTDFRTNQAHVVRNRKLVIQSIATIGEHAFAPVLTFPLLTTLRCLANYEYSFNFIFDLAGAIELEVKATGIVNAYVLAEGEARDPEHEVIVAPRIAAQHHQHLFSLRVDPMVDGLKNQVVQVDCVPDEAPLGSDTNFYGNGFSTKKTLFATSKESVSDYNCRTSRSWAIENPNKQHKASGANVAYKIGK